MKKKLPRYRIKERTQIFGDTRIISTFYPQELFKLFWLFPIYVNMSDRNTDIICASIEDARAYIDKQIDKERNNRIVKDVKRYRTYSYGQRDEN